MVLLAFTFRVVGNFEYQQVSQVAPMMAPPFFIVFVFVFFLFMMNMFIAIISEYYTRASTVKHDNWLVSITLPDSLIFFIRIFLLHFAIWNDVILTIYVSCFDRKHQRITTPFWVATNSYLHQLKIFSTI